METTTDDTQTLLNTALAKREQEVTLHVLEQLSLRNPEITLRLYVSQMKLHDIEPDKAMELLNETGAEIINRTYIDITTINPNLFYMGTGENYGNRHKRPERHALTDDDLLDIRAEFIIKVDLLQVKKVLERPENKHLIHSGRAWGWGDTEVRDQLCELLDIVI